MQISVKVVWTEGGVKSMNPVDFTFSFFTVSTRFRYNCVNLKLRLDKDAQFIRIKKSLC